MMNDYYRCPLLPGLICSFFYESNIDIEVIKTGSRFVCKQPRVSHYICHYYSGFLINLHVKINS